MVLAALLGGLLSVAHPGSAALAQNRIPPVAIAVIGDTTTDSNTGVMTAQLDGSGSFAPDGTIASYSWEVVTESYSWLQGQLSGANTATATFPVPAAALAARWGQSIQFRLTVTDSGSPPATATATVTFNINQGPAADIAVSAKLPAPSGEQIADYDDDEDGMVDENDERYTREGVIHEPGENGNDDNEWTIREGSLLVIDGSGSSAGTGPLPDSAFLWERLYASDITQVTSTLPPSRVAGSKVLSTDEDPLVAASVSSETLGRLPYVRGEANSIYYLYYRLTVTDALGSTATSVVKIVIRDAHDNPTVEIGYPESDPGAATDEDKRDGVLAAGEDRYVISTEVAEQGVTLTAVGQGDGAARTRELVHTWTGSGVSPSSGNGPGAQTTAVFTAPENVAQGDSFVAEVEVADPSGQTGTTLVELVVADTRPPTASAPADITTNDGADGGFPVADPPTGMVTLRGLGFDPDGDPLTFKWEQVRNEAGDPLNVTYRGPLVLLNGSTQESAWFAPPEVTQGLQYNVYVKFTVTDRWGVSDADVVAITVLDGEDDLRAITGPPHHVLPGDFVRLHGGFSSGMVSADVAESVTHTWTYTGIETFPPTEQRPPITDDEKEQGFVFGGWFPHDGLDDNGDPDPEEEAGTYSTDAGGRVKFINGRYPYFDAPGLGGFHSVKLFFKLTVAVPPIGGQEGQEATDTVVVTVLGKFFSGVVDGPDFCANLSLGGPKTYPFDRDRDGVADNCSLRGTRRGAVARQNALETLAAVNPDLLATALYGKPDDPETTDVDESTGGTCATAPTGLGDTEKQLDNDACGRVKRGAPPDRGSPSLPAPADPQQAARFFSGYITGPNFCANLSLGGSKTYAFDKDGDGVADNCALPSSRREAVARQNALETLANHAQYEAALAAACAALGTLYFGDPARALAQDACAASPTDQETGKALPVQG